MAAVVENPPSVDEIEKLKKMDPVIADDLPKEQASKKRRKKKKKANGASTDPYF